MDYEVFNIRIFGGIAGKYELHVESPAGEGKGSLEIPGDLLGWLPDARVNRSEAARDVARRVRQAPAPSGEELRARGEKLYRAIFSEEVAKLFHASLGGLRGDHDGLRIRIEIDPGCSGVLRLQSLPWELLCMPETGDFLALSRRTPVVRWLRAHRERRAPPARPDRLRVLAVGENVSGEPPLDLERERNNLRAAFAGSPTAVELVFQESSGLEDIRREFVRGSFHVLLFMGHGGFDPESGGGVLYFKDSLGQTRKIAGEALAQEIRDFPSLRLVVLNACHSAESADEEEEAPLADVASALVLGGTPAVVAMRGPISDVSAITFSRTFFERLAAGEPIDTGLAEARKAIRREEPIAGEWALPVLFLRQADGHLFRRARAERRRQVSVALALLALLAAFWVLGMGWRQERRQARAANWNDSGLTWLKEGNHAKALEAFRYGLEIDPQAPGLLSNLSAAEEAEADFPNAVAHAEQAARWGESTAEAAEYFFNLGVLLNRIGRETEALQWLQRAIDRDPEQAPFYNEMGVAYLGLQRFADARQALLTGAGKDAKFAPLFKNLAQVELKAPGGDLEAAARLLKEAEALYPLDDWQGRAAASYELAVTAKRLHRVSEACDALNRFFSLAPHQVGDDEAVELQRELRCGSP